MFKYLFALLIFVSNLNCITVESDSIKSVFDYLAPNTLVLFDIDNTLATTTTTAGSDEWFSAKVKQEMDLGFDATQAINHVLPDYFYVQFYTSLIPVEKDVNVFLKNLENKNVQFMALTARSLYMASRTVDQMKALNIKFNFFSDQKISLKLANPSIYNYGILFCGLNEKGDALLSLLDHFDCKPDRIIFVDDKHKNLISVELAALKRQIDFVGIRLNTCDEKVKNIDMQKAEKELVALKKKMSRSFNF